MTWAHQRALSRFFSSGPDVQDVLGYNFHDLALDTIRYVGAAFDHTVYGYHITFPGSFDHTDDTGFVGNDPNPDCPALRMPATIVVRPELDRFRYDWKAHCRNAGHAGDVRGRTDFADQVHSVFRFVDHSELPMLRDGFAYIVAHSSFPPPFLPNITPAMAK